MDFTSKYEPFTNKYGISNKKCIILIAYQPFA